MNPAEMSSHGFRRYALPVCVAVVVLDQLSKAAVLASIPLHGRVTLWPGLLALTHVHNRGMAFGLFSDLDGRWLRWALALVALAAVYVIWSYARHERHRPAVLVAFGAILGGALGNLVDRLRFGYVVDFVLAHWDLHEFPAFNVADSAITLGGILLFLALAREERDTLHDEEVPVSAREGEDSAPATPPADSC